MSTKTQSVSLISTMNRVEVPFVKVTIGNYTFGVYDKVTSNGIDANGVYHINRIQFPNYVQGLNIEKINGVVNKYSLKIAYPITQNSDPNFFYKVFSSVSQTRKIVFSYGDLSAPTFCFRDEEAIILGIKEDFVAGSAVINYTISAISKGAIVANGSFNFTSKDWVGKKKVSKLIKKLLYTQQYGLLEVFYGMNNKSLVEQENLIYSDDIEVTIEPKTNISSLDYLQYLISCMKINKSSTLNGNTTLFSLVVMDETSSKFNGPYFKVVPVSVAKNSSLAYEVDYGYPSSNVVTSFSVENDDSYSIFFNFFEQLNQEVMVQRVDDSGNIVEVYAPILGSNNVYRKATEAEKFWWSKVTQFPIKAKLTIKGLLRPAMLMSHIKMNVYCYGRKHVSSGLYIVTKQQDSIDTSGYRTTLSLLRVDKADDLDIV